MPKEGNSLQNLFPTSFISQFPLKGFCHHWICLELILKPNFYPGGSDRLFHFLSLLFILSSLQKENLHIILLFLSPFSLTEFTFDWGMLQPSNLLSICQLVEQEVSVEENPASVLIGSRENEANYCREADRESKPVTQPRKQHFSLWDLLWLWQPC